MCLTHQKETNIQFQSLEPENVVYWLRRASWRTWGEGGVKLPQMHFKRAQNSGFFYVKRREEGQGNRCLTPQYQQGSKEEHETSKSLCSWGFLTPADLSLGLEVLSNQASRKIPRIISIFITGAICLKAMGEMQSKVYFFLFLSYYII